MKESISRNKEKQEVKKPDVVKERLTPDEVYERERIIEEITGIVELWVEKNVPKHETLTQARLGRLVKHLGAEHWPLIDRITEMYEDIKKCPERPTIKICSGREEDEGPRRPDVWLLLWRCEKGGAMPPEETDIHDHLDSQVGVYVHKGEVEEEAYAFDAFQWSQGKKNLKFRKIVRGFGEGGTITIQAPYIHTVRGVPDQELAVTIHAYYPPLDEMNFYEIKGDSLIKTGHWKEDKDCHC